MPMAEQSYQITVEWYHDLSVRPDMWSCTPFARANPPPTAPFDAAAQAAELPGPRHGSNRRLAGAVAAPAPSAVLGISLTLFVMVVVFLLPVWQPCDGYALDL